MTQKSRYFLVASAVALVVGLGGGLAAYLYQRGARSAGLPAELRYVPANAALVAYVNVRSVVSSELHRELMPAVEDRSRKGRQMMSDFAGVDLEKQVDHVLMYVERFAGTPPNTEQPPSPPPALMLVQGTFEQSRIEQFLRDHGATAEDHNGHRMLVRPGGAEETAVGFIRADLLAVGQSALVRRALDVSGASAGPDLTSNAELMGHIRDAANSTAWVVGDFDAFSRGMRLPSAVSRQASTVRLMSARADVNGGVRATVRADTVDQPSADQLRDVVRGFVSLARLQAGAKPEFETVLKSIQLSGSDKTVQMTFAISPQTIRALAPHARPNPEP